MVQWVDCVNINYYVLRQVIHFLNIKYVPVVWELSNLLNLRSIYERNN